MTYTPEETALKIGCSTATLARWRQHGGSAGPVYYKLGKAVRYSPEAVADWLSTRQRTSTSGGR